MYTIAIVTSSLYDYGVEFLSKYSSNGTYKIICIYNNRTKARSKQKIFKKIFKIGITGALIGMYLRKYYKSSHSNIREFCIEKNIPFYTIENFKIPDQQKSLFNQIDIGISLGNGYIPSTFFNVFKNGMINIHHEILPDYPGASSVIWPIYDTKNITGFTIHRINKNIDAGTIIYKELIPISFKSSLGETISENYKFLKSKSIDSINETILKLINNDYQEEANNSTKSYTTPTLFQYIKILNNFKKLKRNNEKST